MSIPSAPAWMEWVNAPLLLMPADGASVVALNSAARRLFGTLKAPEPPCALADLIGADAAASFLREGFLRAGRQDESGPQVVNARIGGGRHTLSLEASGIEQPAGHVLVTIQDRITEQEAGSYISTLYEDLQAILEWLPIGVEVFDGTGNCVFTNTHGAKMFGWGADELNEIEEWWLHAYPDPDYRELVKRAWAEAIATSREEGSAVMLSDWLVTCKDGSQKLAHFHFRCVGDLQVLVYWDVSEQRRMEAELRLHADTDALTGLQNRRGFFTGAVAAAEVAEAAGEPVSVLMIDIDHFKTINDRFGHAVGDAVLRAVAEKCRQALRDTDVLARLGGEEFVALLPATDESVAAQIAEQLRTYICVLPIEVDSLLLRVTVSIGLTTAERTFDIDDMLGEADRALYAAKHAGRNRVMVFGTHLHRDPLSAAE